MEFLQKFQNNNKIQFYLKNFLNTTILRNQLQILNSLNNKELKA